MGVVKISNTNLLSEKGFDKSPEQSIVVDWFYDKHNIWIDVFIDDDKTFGYFISQFTKDGRLDSPTKRGFKTSQDAYEVAIEYVLINKI
jgi:hypothetical protein